MITVTFLPSGKKQQISQSTSLLNLAQRAGLLMDISCGGRGICGKCKVKINTGLSYPPDKTEKSHLKENELLQGWRLACRVNVNNDMIVEIPAQETISGNKQKMIYLPENFICNRKSIPSCTYGIAFDIGTTTVAGMLWDLEKGVMIHATSRTNPQSSYGADIISRIMCCMQEKNNIKIMQTLIIDCINDIIKELIEGSGIDAFEIGLCTIVGNTTMSHLLLGVDPTTLAVAPFKPGFRGVVQKKANELGLFLNSEANIHVLPNIAGHVGSDIVAVILASGLSDMKGVNLAIDIGTNGEIILANNGRILTCSTAAGPAFEGASIYHGMRAMSGAIKEIRINGDKTELSVIGGGIPKGICGSGLIQGIAVLLDAGIINKTGKLLGKKEGIQKGISENIIKRLRDGEKGREFVLYEGVGTDIVLTQKDIREVQLAKAAIYAGIQILMKELDINTSMLNLVLLAGAFGNHMDRLSALKIGLLPAVPEEKVITIGNAAGTGASMALLSEEHLQLAYELSKEAEHIELAGDKCFQTAYLNAMDFNKFED